jgi:hypothetical protein
MQWKGESKTRQYGLKLARLQGVVNLGTVSEPYIGRIDETQNQRRNEGIRMEEHRCKIAATGIEDGARA